MTKQQFRIALAIYIAWSFIHLVFLFVGFSKDGCCEFYFWPFAESEFSVEKTTIVATYDLSEFITYTGTPIVIFIINELLVRNAKENEEKHKTTK